MSARDLLLAYKFTDRSGNKVFDIKQEILSTSEIEEKRFLILGELRISPDQNIKMVHWHFSHITITCKIEKYSTG